jgi:hypothetical protein
MLVWYITDICLQCQGSEAEERGEDFQALKNRGDLIGPALQLAKRAGSTATDVAAAMKDLTFRVKGLLPHFASANRQIAASSQASFTILCCTFLRATDWGQSELS